ncbi:hypothetical protein [Microbacterium sp.]|uniref:hypothetical protein n=1 Tax=Microbacterium sp. TaxID=51671 RepID=UPI003A9261A4
MESVRGQGDDEILRKRFALFARELGTTTTVSWGAEASRAGLQDVIENWLDAHPASARLVDTDHATEARMIVNFSITLGDEVMRLVAEDGEDFLRPRSVPDGTRADAGAERTRTVKARTEDRGTGPRDRRT